MNRCCLMLSGALLAHFACGAAPDVRREVVKASEFGWNPTNATKCLQAALDSGAKTVIVDRQASEWLVGMLFPRSNTEIVFADGVKVRAVPGSMKRIVDNLFRFRNVSNIVFRGESPDRSRAVLQMNVADYLDKTRYQHGEHRHCVSLHGAENVVVRDLTLLDSGGDGVYVLGVKHALLENLYCSGHARQGTSVISADDVTIRNCVFTHTKGALPECGMDIEPGHSVFNVGKILIENCDMCSNNCSGVAVNVSGLKGDNQPMNVTYRNCRMFDNAARGIWFILARGTWAPVKGGLFFDNCRICGNGGGPCQISNLGSDALRLGFLNCTFDAAGVKPGNGSPIQIVNGNIKDDLNNIRFKGCKLLNVPDGAKPVSFAAMTGCGVLPGGAKGVLDVTYASGREDTFDFATLEKLYPPKPELRSFETGSVDPKAFVPANRNGKAAKQKPAGYRGGFTFLQYVQKPGAYPIRFTSTQIGKYSKMEIPVEVFDVNGTPHDTFTVREPDFTYMLKAQGKDTVYRFVVKYSGRRVTLRSETPGQGFVANDRVHWLTGNDQGVYFEAKKGAEDVKVEITMSAGEWISAELVAPDGTVKDRCEHTDAGVILAAKRPKNAPSEIWQLHVTRFTDDAHVRLGSGTGGVYAYDPALLLIEK